MAGAPAAILGQEVTLSVKPTHHGGRAKRCEAWLPADTVAAHPRGFLCVGTDAWAFSFFFFFCICSQIYSELCTLYGVCCVHTRVYACACCRRWGAYGPV